ncbi:MAG: universal stress protein [Bacteroidales bacterium]|nr:universal stress protein [Bacteroidales bacterium]
MEKTILVGIDFSECSMNALSHAVSIAEKSESKILMVWVNKYKNQPLLDKSLIVSGARQNFDSLIGQYSEVLGKENISYTIREGGVFDEIKKLCDEINPMLVVVGTHGISGISEKWLGSNAYRLSLLLKTPVITIRNGIDVNKTLSTILLPIDSTVETRQKLPITATLAKYFGATIYILAVYTSDIDVVNARINNYVKQTAEYLAEYDINYVTDEIRSNDIADDVIAYANRINANLISIMDEQEISLKNIFAGSNSLQIVTKSLCPVLISHSKNIYSTIMQ